MQISAIETDYRGVTFRSRLEAKWAAFFDLCNWTWQYEPLDLNGYIPDFVLQLPHAPVLVEVKPELYIKDLFRHTEKIEKSGWDNESLIVGVALFDGEDGSAIGILDQRDNEPGEQSPRSHNWEPAVFQTCLKCKRRSFYHSVGSYRCRVEGCYDGNTYCGPESFEDAKRLFAHASEIVRWKP